MDELLNNSALLALIATVFGGVGLKIIEHWLNKAKTKADSAAEIRTELRTDISRLREDLASIKAEKEEVEHELDEWKGKFYTLMSDFIKIRAELDACLNALKKYTEAANQKLKNFGGDEG